MLLLAWGLLVLNSCTLLAQAGLIEGFSWLQGIRLLLLFAGFAVWFLLLIRYFQALRWIKRLSKTMEVNPVSYQKVARKWNRVLFQLFLIVFLLLAFLIFEFTQPLHKVLIEPWIVVGVWAVWVHSMIWFTLAWNRDQRLKRRLERDLQDALDKP